MKTVCRIFFLIVWLSGASFAQTTSEIKPVLLKEDTAGIGFLFSQFQTNLLESHLQFLASDVLEGRESGQRGQKIAAEYIQAQFKRIGLLPPFVNKRNQRTYLQPYTFQKTIHAENVAGMIAGSDTSQEAILITAHFDHLGIRNGQVYNGADDNASGTSGILTIAESMMSAVRHGWKPRRSILFVAFSGEEKGLHGSEYFSKHSCVPTEKIVAVLNVDMIGRVDSAHEQNPMYVYVIGSDFQSAELHQINEKSAEITDSLQLDYLYNSKKHPSRLFYRSDHYHFAENNIPCIFYFSGFHKDYHKPTDDIEKINFEKAQKISQLIAGTAWILANRQERIR